jgi:hypothetical protein
VQHGRPRGPGGAAAAGEATRKAPKERASCAPDAAALAPARRIRARRVSRSACGTVRRSSGWCTAEARARAAGARGTLERANGRAARRRARGCARRAASLGPPRGAGARTAQGSGASNCGVVSWPWRGAQWSPAFSHQCGLPPSPVRSRRLTDGRIDECTPRDAAQLRQRAHALALTRVAADTPAACASPAQAVALRRASCVR